MYTWDEPRDDGLDVPHSVVHVELRPDAPSIVETDLQGGGRLRRVYVRHLRRVGGGGRIHHGSCRHRRRSGQTTATGMRLLGVPLLGTRYSRRLDASGDTYMIFGGTVYPPTTWATTGRQCVYYCKYFILSVGSFGGYVHDLGAHQYILDGFVWAY